MAKPISDFNDAPISCPEDDRFAIDPFARSIAKCIKRLPNPVGSVVAVHGRWGSGKSSVINLVGYHLDHPDNGLIIIQFQCWLYRSEDALTVGFLQELHAGLGPVLSNSSKARKALRKLGGRVLGASGNLLGVVVGEFVGAFWGRIITSASRTFENLIKTNEGTEALQHTVAEALRQSTQRLLVVVDDIDRLSPEEALVIFRLIKSVGRLPNVIYLLAYDRNTVEKAVEKRHPSEGPHYLEKIIQMGFDLPEPTQEQLITMLRSKIDEVFGNTGNNNPIHWENLFLAIVVPEIRTPRDVLRLSNTLSVTYPAVRGEVEPADYLGLETLRLFRPSVYRAVRSQKSRLVGFGFDGPHGNHDQKAERYEQLFLSQEPEGDRARLKDGLGRLFPQLESVWSNVSDSGDERWAKQRRVCSSEHFDTYFRFSISQYTVPLSEIQELIRRADEPDIIRSLFKDALNVHQVEGRTKASVLLDEVRYHSSTMEIQKVGPFLQTLYCVADDLLGASDSDRDLESIDNRLRLLWLTRALLMDRIELPARSEILVEACKSASIGWLVHIGYSVFKDEQPVPLAERLTTEEAASRIRDLALQRLREAAKDGSILGLSDLAYILFLWRDMVEGKSEEVREFCTTALGNDQSVVKLARAFLRSSTSHSSGDLVSRKHDRVEVEGIKTLMDADFFRTRLQEVLQKPTMGADDKDIVQRLLVAWDSS